MDVLETFCNQRFSINDGLHPNISLYHEIRAKKKKKILIRVHFHFTTTLSQCYNYKKDYKGLDLMLVYL
jgi:hypothetical protein